jgi:hypothetical protein
MNVAEVSRMIIESFKNVETTEASDNIFFFYASERHFPFATLVVNDVNDTASDLERPGVFRLNIGVKRATYQNLFGLQPTFAKGGGIIDTGYDYTALDKLMPHPVYAPMSWVCIVSPSAETFEKVVLPLLREAYEQDVMKHNKQEARDR